MKKIIFAVICVVLMVLISIVSSTPKPVYTEMIPISKPVVIKENKIYPLDIKNLNITSFASENASLTIKQGYSIAIKLKTKVYFEKDICFRLFGRFAGRLECDLGSNCNEFWFWSRKMEPPGLYFARQSEIARTRLKTPFNPNWMLESLGFSPLKTENATVKEDDDFIALTQEKLSILKQPIKQITLIDKSKNIVVGNYIYDLNDNLIVSSETTDFHILGNLYFPKTIEIIWPEESVKLTLDFPDIKINQRIPIEMWAMPDYQPKNNMAGR